MTTTRVLGPIAAVLGGILLAPAALAQSAGGAMPRFEVDPSWPTIPNDWVLGEVTSIAVAPDNDVWVLHRPNSIPEGERSRAAPPVLEFDQQGRLLSSWGGPSDDYDWPEREHGIWIAADGDVWISGNGGWPRVAPGGSTDDMILKFTAAGELLMQIGARGASAGNDDTTNVHQPAVQFVDERTNELYVADGYGNQRVIVFDADTGAFRRLWGAYGNVPGASSEGRAGEANAAGAAEFGLVHAVKVSNDGVVYVADRGNQRIQWFTSEGRFIDELVIEGEATPAPAGFAFSPDREQRLLYVVESANARVIVFERRAMRLIGEFGMRTSEPGGMDIAHHIAVDANGNLYTAEIVNNRRAQKFVLQ